MEISELEGRLSTLETELKAGGGVTDAGAQSTAQTLRTFMRAHLRELSSDRAQQVHALLHADQQWSWQEQLDLLQEGSTLLHQAWRA